MRLYPEWLYIVSWVVLLPGILSGPLRRFTWGRRHSMANSNLVPFPHLTTGFLREDHV